MNTSNTYMKAHDITRVFGVTETILINRGALKVRQGNAVMYDVESFMACCTEEIYNTLRDRLLEASENKPISHKDKKTAQEVRRLTIQNDKEEGLLVSAAEVEIMYSKGMKIVCSELDGLPTQVRMNSPNVAQGVLDTINRCLINIRNKVANMEIEDVTDGK